MFRVRVIPTLLLKGESLVKTRRFAKPLYVGDPINAVRIFNEREVDELIFLDIAASQTGVEPSYSLIQNIASECFMPLCYGGGISHIDQIKKLFEIGIEKVAICSSAYENLDLISTAASVFGSQSIVGVLNIKKTIFGSYQLYIKGSQKKISWSVSEGLKKLQDAGAGEILINSIDRDGMMNGYDIELIKKISDQVHIPLIVCGGAGNFDHLRLAILEGGASSVAAGSLFVLQAATRSVLISYPDSLEIDKLSLEAQKKRELK